MPQRHRRGTDGHEKNRRDDERRDGFGPGSRDGAGRVGGRRGDRYLRGGIWISSVNCSLVSFDAVNFSATASLTI